MRQVQHALLTPSAVPNEGRTLGGPPHPAAGSEPGHIGVFPAPGWTPTINVHNAHPLTATVAVQLDNGLWLHVRLTPAGLGYLQRLADAVNQATGAAEDHLDTSPPRTPR